MITIDDVKRNYDLIDRFIEQENKLVVSIVNRYFPHLKYSDDYEDILQIATIGLYQSIVKFDISMSNKFSTFAVIKILSAVKSYLRADNKGGLSTTNKMISDWRKYLYFTSSIGYTDNEVAKELNVTLDYITKLKIIMRSVIKYEDLKNNNDESIGSIENLAVADYNLENECIRNIEFEEKIDMLRELLPSKYIKMLALRLNGMNQVDISKRIKSTPNDVGKGLDRIYQTITSCVNPYYNGEIRFIELQNRMRNILMIESEIQIGGDEMAMSINLCKEAIKRWAVTNPGQSIKVKQIIEEAGYIVDGSISLSTVKMEAINELREEGYEITRKGTAYWVESKKPKENVPQHSVTADDMREIVSDIIQGIDIGFDRVKGIMEHNDVDVCEVDSTDCVFRISDRIITTDNFNAITRIVEDICMFADSNGKKIQATIILKEV